MKQNLQIRKKKSLKDYRSVEKQMHPIRYQEDNLFNKWRETFSVYPFIYDGVVCPEIWENENCAKLVFILRDMNCREDQHDLRKDLAEFGSGWKTWNNIARWTKALLDGENEYPKDMRSANRIIQLRRIATMNLKKEGGSNRTDPNKLSNFVKEQSSMIYSQIKIYSPDMIVCCGLSSGTMTGNATLLKDHVLNETTEWGKIVLSQTNHTWWYYKTTINNKIIPVISFCHPQTCNLGGKRGHEHLYIPLYKDMLELRFRFLGQS